MQSLKLGNKADINKGLQESFKEAKLNPKFNKLIKSINLNDEVAMKYTSKLEDT